MIPDHIPVPEASTLPVAPAGADYYYEQDSNGEVYAVFPSVPVFDEHEGRDGTVYDRALLAKIASNCNLRTVDTGDKCPIVGWHTPEDKDPHKMPPVIGWAEDFRVEDFGRSDTRGCIFSKFKVFADELKYFLRHPRRSVEIWKGKNPEDRFFDPIAVLGAETPKRDLGLIYSRSGDGDESEHYAMPVYPGGSNTSIPSGSLKKEDYDKPPKNDPRRTPAPKKDQVKGSDKNAPGSAKKPNKRIKLSDSVEKKLSKLSEETPGATVGMLKSVWRRGAGAYSTSHHPNVSRDGWAMARVNAFIKLLKSGKPSNPDYVQDNDLLPSSHKKSTSEKNTQDKYKMDSYESQASNEMQLSKDSIGQIIEALKPTIQDMIQQEMVSKSEEPKMQDELKTEEEVEGIGPENAEESLEDISSIVEEGAGVENSATEEQEDEEEEKDRNAKADAKDSKEDYLAPLAGAALQALPAVAGMMGGGGEQNAEEEEEKVIEQKEDSDSEEDNSLDHLIAEIKKDKKDKVPDDDSKEKNGMAEDEDSEKCMCKDKHAMELGKRLMSGMKEKYGEDYEAMAGYMQSLDESDKNALESYGECKKCSGEDYEKYQSVKNACGGKESYAQEASEEASSERYEREAEEAAEKYAALEREASERYSALEREHAEKYAALERESQERYSELNERYGRAMDEITELKCDVAEARTAERYSKIEKEISALASDGYVVDVEREVKYCMTLTEEQYSEHVGERIPEMYRRAPIGPIIPVEASPELKVSNGENLSEKYARSAKEVVLKDRSKSFREVLEWMVSNDSSEYPSV